MPLLGKKENNPTGEGNQLQGHARFGDFKYSFPCFQNLGIVNGIGEN